MCLFVVVHVLRLRKFDSISTKFKQIYFHFHFILFYIFFYLVLELNFFSRAYLQYLISIRQYNFKPFPIWHLLCLCVTADDCFQLGKVAYNNEDFYHAIKWFDQALRIDDFETNKTACRSVLLDYQSFSVFKVCHGYNQSVKIFYDAPKSWPESWPT